jgi:hypothetical protein
MLGQRIWVRALVSTVVRHCDFYGSLLVTEEPIAEVFQTSPIRPNLVQPQR